MLVLFLGMFLKSFPETNRAVITHSTAHSLPDLYLPTVHDWEEEIEIHLGTPQLVCVLFPTLYLYISNLYVFLNVVSFQGYPML